MLTLGHLIAALSDYDGERSPQPITGAVVDSRAAAPNSLFVAFPGETADGHDFVADAFARGAVAALVQRPVPGEHSTLDLRNPLDPAAAACPDLPVCLLVEDTLTALQRAARYWRLQHNPTVVGITGSVGKTTTKELVFAVLASRFATLKSPGNLNNEIGLPLTLLHLTRHHQQVVLEMGMYTGGEISTLTDIARPQIGVVTNVGPVHLERLGSLKAIADAKAELVEALPPAPDGVAILNLDEPLVRGMADRTRARVFTYGLSPQADLWASNIESAGLEGIRFSLHYLGETVHIRAHLLGRHSVHTALRAAAVGLVAGLGWGDIVEGLQGESLQLRLVAVQGPNDSLLLDDTYNASPASTIAALNLLAELENRRVAVLGDMLELGAYEETGHRLVGRRAAAVADLLVTVGPRGQIIAEEALAAGMDPNRVIILPDVQAALQTLPPLIRPQDMVLVKASHGVALDRLVYHLIHGAGAAHQEPEETR